jgi:ketosteroid isomerase-like protein
VGHEAAARPPFLGPVDLLVLRRLSGARPEARDERVEHEPAALVGLEGADGARLRAEGERGEHARNAALISNYELTNGTQKLEIHGIFADDDHGVVVLRETATRNDGATLDMEESHVLSMRDGKVTHVWDLPTDPEAHDRFFDGR